jgi:type II secretory pathway component PulF
MPVIVTPQQLSQRAELYHQLAALTSAGVGLVQATKMLRDSPPHRSLRPALRVLAGNLEQGATLTDGFRALDASWVPAFDLALIQAGENSGRIDASFRLLSEHYHERAQLARRVLADLFYPALVLHLAVLIFPVGQLTRLVWQGDVAGFLVSKAVVLIPCYALLLLLLQLTRSNRGERWRSCLELLLKPVPVVGNARFNLALARLSAALESLINAGVSIIEAWDLAAAASGSPAIRRVVLNWKPRVLAGQTPAEAVRESRVFPEMFTNLYATGEISGQLDDTLRRLARHYREESSRQFQIFAQWLPRLIYFAVLLTVAYQVVAFWSGYFSQLNQLTQ